MGIGSAIQQYILMPRDGLRDKAMLDPLLHPDRQPKLLSAMLRAQPKNKEPKRVTGQIKVIDSVHEDGMKLAELTPEAIFNLRSTLPGVRVVPVIHYRTADRRYFVESVFSRAGKASGDLEISVRCRSTGAPLPGATVVAFTNFAEREGATGTTDKMGTVRLFPSRNSISLERLLIYPPHGYWGFSSKDARVSSGDKFTLQPIDRHPSVLKILQVERHVALGNAAAHERSTDDLLFRDQRGMNILVGLAGSAETDADDLPALAGDRDGRGHGRLAA